MRTAYSTRWETPSLHSIEQREVAYYLTDFLYASLAGGVDSDAMLQDLRELRDAVWPKQMHRPLSQPELQQFFQAKWEKYSETERSRFMEIYTMMGQLYELSGSIARDNFFRQLQAQGEASPGGAQEYVESKPATATAELIAQLNRPIVELTMTAHPTSVNSPDSIEHRRELAISLDVLRDTGNAEPFTKALRAYANTPVLPHDMQHHDRNLSVFDETNLMLYYLDCVYQDLPQIYGQFDAPLSAREDYDPASLQLQLRYGSWGSSGDKDGNNNVNADTTLEAIALHKHKAVTNYLRDLGQIASLPLMPWQAQLREAKTALEAQLQLLADVREQEKSLLPEQFDEISAAIAAIKLDSVAFAEDIAAAHRADPNPELLNLLRRVRTFGFTFGKIEYRETAEEYTRVVSKLTEKLFNGYDTMSENERVRALSGLLYDFRFNANNELALTQDQKDKIRPAIAEVMAHGHGRKYDKEDVLPIAYHTLKRMELARDHGDIIKDNVLAECQQESNLLEALLLQLVAEIDGRRPQMGIIPLFEDPEVMENVGNILKAAYSNQAYRAHVSKLDNVQQIQIAHSDNARRSGIPAARSYIHEAHEIARTVGRAHGITTQFFEGGSLTDPYRNGVRAPSATVNAYESHDFFKNTIQNVDNDLVLGTPISDTRSSERLICHSAGILAANGKTNGNGHSISKEATTILNHIISEAFEATLKDYQRNYFTPEAMGQLLAYLNYPKETKAGARGSRATARVAAKEPLPEATATEPGVTVIRSIEEVQNIPADIKPVDIESTRTIGFSEAWQHNGISPIWFASRTIPKVLEKSMHKWMDHYENGDYNSPASAEVHRLLLTSGYQQGNGLPSRIYKALYDHSDVGRDVFDRLAYGVATTDFESAQANLRIPPDNPFFNQLKQEYILASRLAVAALTGQSVLDRAPPTVDDGMLKKAREAALNALPHLQTTLRDRSRFLQVLHVAKNDHNRPGEHLLGVIHAAGDAAHGRHYEADDPKYRTRRYASETGAAMAR